MTDMNVVPVGIAAPFERIRRYDDAGMEFWSSRELAQVLGYEDYRNFVSVLEKARIACDNSGIPSADHFVDVTEMVTLGSGAKREVATILLSRYACYLVVQNADPRKEIVAHGQTYFALQTRRQELADEQGEDKRRLLLRSEVRRHNVQLADAAKDAGVIRPIEYAIFQNHGYMGLYGGMKEKVENRQRKLNATPEDTQENN